MRGLKLRVPIGDFIAKAIETGILVIAAGDNVARILPPLIINPSHIQEAYGLLDQVCQAFEADSAARPSEQYGPSGQ